MNPQIEKDNLIVNLSFDFAIKIMTFCDKLCQNKQYAIADQLLRSALSIGANVREAQSAESIADFIHKMKISSKEAEEAQFYLQLIAKAYTFQEVHQLLNDIASINRVLNRIIASSKNKKIYSANKAITNK